MSGTLLGRATITELSVQSLCNLTIAPGAVVTTACADATFGSTPNTAKAIAHFKIRPDTRDFFGIKFSVETNCSNIFRRLR
jgi:hypothetical protein